MLYTFLPFLLPLPLLSLKSSFFPPLAFCSAFSWGAQPPNPPANIVFALLSFHSFLRSLLFFFYLLPNLPVPLQFCSFLFSYDFFFFFFFCFFFPSASAFLFVYNSAIISFRLRNSFVGRTLSHGFHRDPYTVKPLLDRTKAWAIVASRDRTRRRISQKSILCLYCKCRSASPCPSRLFPSLKIKKHTMAIENIYNTKVGYTTAAAGGQWSEGVSDALLGTQLYDEAQKRWTPFPYIVGPRLRTLSRFWMFLFLLCGLLFPSLQVVSSVSFTSSNGSCWACSDCLGPTSGRH